MKFLNFYKSEIVLDCFWMNTRAKNWESSASSRQSGFRSVNELSENVIEQLFCFAVKLLVDAFDRFKKDATDGAIKVWVFS